MVLLLNYTCHFVYSPLNSYVYIHWILDFKYILLFIKEDQNDVGLYSMDSFAINIVFAIIKTELMR